MTIHESSPFNLDLDLKDELSFLRDEFNIPKHINEQDATYLCGNSLGIMPKQTEILIKQELSVWSNSAVNGHFNHPHNRPWVAVDDLVIEEMAKIVGAIPMEIAIMNSLTVNLHLLMISMYRPTSNRYKILMEGKAFPSDYYAIESQVKFHGYDPADAIIQVNPSSGKFTLETQDIIRIIQEQGSEIALCLFSGVQYYTGQLFDIEAITKHAKEKGCVVGFDLAHAVGNVPLELHKWGVDFAVWCTYKYLNSGPGSIGGAFIHEIHSNNTMPRLTGWWGTNPSSKFQMNHNFEAIPGAYGYRMSNPCVLAVISLLGSLEIFKKTNMKSLRKKSIELTGYLESLLYQLAEQYPVFQIITPSDPNQRGCQLSVLFKDSLTMEHVFNHLKLNGVVCDERRPDVIRISPTPLYNSFKDVYTCVSFISAALREL